MRNYFIKFVLSLGVIVALYACTDLELEDTDSVSRETIEGGFNGVSDVEASLVSAYNAVQGFMGGNFNSLWSLQENTSDAIIAPTRGTDWGNNGVSRTLDQHNWDTSHPHLLNIWNRLNSSVFTLNEIIDPSSNAGAQQLAEAKFLRAFSMFWIIDLYGQVPFRGPNEGPDVDPMVMDRAEAFDFVIRDLEEALPDLPSIGPGEQTDKAAKASAHFLMAKLYLNKHIYQNTNEPAQEDMTLVIEHVDAIRDEGFDLQSGYFAIFEPTVDASDTEIIFRTASNAGAQIWHTLHYSQSTPQRPGGGNNGYTTLPAFFDLFEGAPETNEPGSGQEERRGFVPKDGEQAEAGDLDVNADGIEDGSNIGYGFLIGQQYAIDGSNLTDRSGNPLVFTKELPGLIGNNERTGIRVLKYHPSNGAVQNNFIVFRYADAHLMKAEAIHRGGSSNETALGLVNELREIRQASPLESISDQELLDERGRELYTESWRRHDQVRFGTFDDQWEFKDNTETFRNLFPIPATALASNPNLNQNEGY